MLSKQGIQEAIENGSIKIDRQDKLFNLAQISANSIDLTLCDKIYEFEKDKYWIDALTGKFYYKHIGEDLVEYVPKLITIPKTGYVLKNTCVYLAVTNERVWSDTYVPECKDKSSMGRMFCPTHFNAGLGDLGYKGYYTLEIAPKIDIRVYPGMAIAQMKFEESSHKGEPYKESGRYANDECVPILAKGVKFL